MQELVQAPLPADHAGIVCLDHLPIDVSRRVVQFLLISHRLDENGYSSALHLSGVSEIQRAAVKSGFSHRLDFIKLQDLARAPNLGEDFRTMFTEMMKPDVREINAEAPLVPPIPHDFSDVKVPAPTKLSLFERSYSLDSLSNATMLRSLRLQYRSPEQLKPFLQRLSILHLRELALVTEHTACLHREFCDRLEDRILLSTWFPGVDCLDLCCVSCSRRDEQPAFLWYAIDHFTALKDVTIREPVPDGAIEKLQEIDRIHLCGKAVYQLVEKIPERVVSISTSQKYALRSGSYGVIPERHVEVLTRCRALQEFRFRISRGNEHLALESVAKLTNLRALEIQFSPESGSDFFRGDGMFFELVKTLPCLTEIQIISAQIKYKETRDMLMELGKRLVVYGNSRIPPVQFDEPNENSWSEVEFQASDPQRELEEFIETLRTALLHNPSLRLFDLTVDVRWCKNKGAVTALLPKLEATLRTLERRVPLLYLWYFHDLIGHIQHICDQTA